MAAQRKEFSAGSGISKPVEPAKLVIVIAIVVGRRRQGATFSR
jgi:hypothetical protein